MQIKGFRTGNANYLTTKVKEVDLPAPPQPVNTAHTPFATSGALGAELLGIDLSDSLDAEGAAEIRQALNEHGVSHVVAGTEKKFLHLLDGIG